MTTSSNGGKRGKLLNSTPCVLLGGLTPSRFLADYWQQKPLLVRNALPDFRPPLDADELAGLACEPEVESRIITGKAGGDNWQLRHGPFPESTFAGLGEADWTLLVQAVDHFVPEVAALKQLFHFIPQWRLDDIMVSFAAPGGSVGPHLDQYDVFLIQGHGVRQWQIGQGYDGPPPLLEHPDLQLLSEFHSLETHELATGDMLYLPPGVPHWGIARDACTTFSIGFRAPSYDEVISEFCDHVLAQLAGGERYSDQGMQPSDHGGRIDEDAIKRVQSILSLLQEDNTVAEWLGCYMTAPKYPIEPEPLAGAVNEGDKLVLEPASRLAFTDASAGCVLFADGEPYRGEGAAWEQFVQALCLEHQVAVKSTMLESQSILRALEALVERGVLVHP